MTNLSQNTITFSHNDLDGVGVGILVKAAIGYSDVRYCSYGNVDERINKTLDDIERYETEYPFILIADLGIEAATAERLDRYKGGKRWLDHHKTNIELASRFEWATIDTEASGTLSVYNEYENVPKKYRDFALLVDDYDRWVHAYPDSKQMNRLFFIQGIERFEDRCLHVNEPQKLYNVDKIVLQLEDERIDRYINRLERSTKVYELHGDKRFGIVFADQYQSEAGHELLNRLDLEAIAMIDANNRKISFRSKENFDVASIAKRLGGGGHKNAAGCEFDYKNISDFHGSKYPLLGLQQNIGDAIFELYRRVRSIHEELENNEIEKLFKGGHSE